LLDEQLSEISESVKGAIFSLEEAARDLRQYQETIEANPERLQQIEERLDLISNLKRKYGDTIEEVIEYGRAASEKLEELSTSEERGAELDAEIERAGRVLDELCAELTERRKKLASQF